MKKNSRFVLLLLVLALIAQIPESRVSTLSLNQNNTKNLAIPKCSNENGGGYTMETSAPFAWIEISGSGTRLDDISDTDSEYQTVNFTQGWNFTLYGTEYDKCYVNTDGVIPFKEEDASSYGYIPGWEPENKDCVALFWTDINTNEKTDNGGGDVYYQFLTGPNRLVIQYDNVYSDDTYEEIGSFEAILYSTGEIKFQYKDVNNIEDYPTIGLDHGDTLNFNSYTGIDTASIPVFSKAISFSYVEDSMVKPTFSINVTQNQEFSWFISRLNSERMIAVFGSNWAQDFGLLPNPLRYQKFKINISSIVDNSTHFELNYSLWDYTGRQNDFSDNAAANRSLVYRQDPQNSTTRHELPNLIPLLLPCAPLVYLIHDNLSYFYDYIDYSVYDNETSIDFYKYKLFNGHYLDTNGEAIYDENGTLISVEMEMRNVTTDEEEFIFKLDRLQNFTRTNFSLDLSVGNEFCWMVVNVNQSAMDAYFGDNWEAIFGLPSNPEPLDKTKIQITSIETNSSHWSVNYSLWDWVNFESTYDPLPIQNYTYEYLRDAFNYTSYHILPDTIPKFLPIPTDVYLYFAFLNESFYDLDEPNDYIDLNLTPFIFSNVYLEEEKENYDLYADASYNKKGVLTDLEIEFEIEFSEDSVDYTGLELVYFTEGPKPENIGVNKGDVFEYGMYYCTKNLPEGIEVDEEEVAEIPKREKIEIIFVDAGDPITNRTLVIVSDQFMDANGIWAEETIINTYIYNTTFFFALMLSPIVTTDVNWAESISSFNTEYLSTTEFISITALSDGFSLTISDEELEISMQMIGRYTINGVLNIRASYYNGKEVSSIRLNDFDYEIEGCSGDGGGNDDDDSDGDDTAELSISGVSVPFILISALIGIEVIIIFTRKKYCHNKY